MTKKYIDDDSEDGDTIEVELPARFEVCDRCHGEGKHVNPSIDGDGITESEWREMCHEDDEFPDKYFGGFYDVRCSECGGDRVVLVVNEELLDEKQKAIYEKILKHERDLAHMRWEDAHVMRMEMGGRW